MFVAAAGCIQHKRYQTAFYYTTYSTSSRAARLCPSQCDCNRSGTVQGSLDTFSCR